MREGKDRRVGSRCGIGVGETMRQRHPILRVVGRAVIVNVQGDIEGSGRQARAIQGEGYRLTGGRTRGAGRAGEIREIDDIHIHGVADDGGIGANDPDFVATRGDGGRDGEGDGTPCARGRSQRRRKRPRRIRELDGKLIAGIEGARGTEGNAHAAPGADSGHGRNARNVYRRPRPRQVAKNAYLVYPYGWISMTVALLIHKAETDV